MLFTFSDSIWLYPNPIDFRKQIDGLVILVADHLSLKPASGQLFLFRNRTSNKLKILWWDKNGFWLFYKRLEKGKFKFPSISMDVLELSTEQMAWLLSGLDYTKQPLSPKMQPTNFYSMFKYYRDRIFSGQGDEKRWLTNAIYVLLNLKRKILNLR